MKRSTAATAAAAAAAGTAVAGKLTWDVYRYMMCRDTAGYMAKLLDFGDHPQEYCELRDRKAREMREKPCIHLSTVSDRGQRLEGYYYPAGDKPCGRIVFMVHGFRTNYTTNAGMYYDLFTSRGFDMFCCDNVAHGRSGGRYMGYDFYESRDCLHWIECLKHCFGEDIKLILHGQSMGGATVCKMADQVPDNVKFIVDDCGFTSAVDTLSLKAGRLFPLLRLINRVAAGYDLSETDVRGDVKNSRVPMLFVHGREDMAVPFWMGEELYALCGAEKDCLFVDGAKHVESIYRAPEAYAAKLDAFIAKYM